jgi:hypothetical protein
MRDSRYPVILSSSQTTATSKQALRGDGRIKEGTSIDGGVLFIMRDADQHAAGATATLAIVGREGDGVDCEIS